MGRRPRNAVSLKQIRVIVGDEHIIFPLDANERLEDRKTAKQRVRSLKEKADEIIKSSSYPGMVPVVAPVPYVPELSLQHIEILGLEKMNRPIQGETASSCVAFLNGSYDIFM